MNQTERDDLVDLIEHAVENIIYGAADAPPSLTGIVAISAADAVIAAGYTNRPVALPDREELAFALFATDNRAQSREQSRIDFDMLRAEQKAAGETFYCDALADAAIEAFKQANP